VDSSYSSVSTALASVDEGCKAQVAEAAQRAQAESAAMQALEDERLRSTRSKAAVDAELLHISNTVSSTRASFNSVVQRRALERQAFLDWSTSSQRQADVVAQILSKLYEKRAVITDTDANTSKLHRGAVGGQLDYIIGIFGHMKETISEDQGEEGSKHVKTDAELAKLWQSSKESLQHAAMQYEAKRAQSVQAEVKALQAHDGRELRKTFAEYESRARALLRQFCGAGGRAPTLVDEGGRLMEQLRSQINQALTAMTQISPSISFVQSRQGHRREPVVPRATLRPGAATARASVAETVAVGTLSAPGRHLNSATRGRDEWKEQAQPIPQSALLQRPSSSQPLSAFVHGRNTSNTKLSSSGEHCVLEEQTLTAQIVGARQSATEARADLNATLGKVASLSGWIALAKQQKSSLLQAQQALANDWVVIGTIIDEGTFDSVLADASAELGDVEGDIKTYAASDGAPPLASGLVVTLAAAAKSLSAMQGLPFAALAGVHGDMQVTYAALATSLQRKVDALQGEQDSTNATIPDLRATIDSAESTERQSTQERRNLEAQCDQAFYNGTGGGGALISVGLNVTLASAQPALAGGLRGRRVDASEEAMAWTYVRQMLGASP